jgi:hypothetical protein
MNTIHNNIVASVAAKEHNYAGLVAVEMAFEIFI